MGIYKKLTDGRLRQKCVDGELKHEFMTEADYQTLLDYECFSVVSTRFVLEFCEVGLKKIGKYKKNEYIFEKAAERKATQIIEGSYGKLSDDELQQRCIDGELKHSLMAEDEYELLLGHECFNSDIIPSRVVLKFCEVGLKQINQYEKYEFLFKKAEKKASETEETTIKFVKSKKRTWRFVASVASVCVISVVAVSVFAFGGFNIFDLIRNAFNSPDGISIDNSGNQGFSSMEKFRSYNSIDELLETENVNILYPTKLPDEYSFTDFMFIDYGTHFELMASATEPHILFVVKIGLNNQIESFTYETNGIKYNVIERDGLYTAEWNIGEDYYGMSVSDKATISEIIENLRS